jgi:hypothetical protein
MRMSLFGPLRHFVRRSEMFASGGKAEVRTRAQNDAVDPSRTLNRSSARLKQTLIQVKSVPS